MYNFGKFCCLCLSDKREMQNINNCDINDITIEQKIQFCLLPDVNLQEFAPNFICYKCLVQLRQSYDFMAVCLKNISLLNKCLVYVNETKEFSDTGTIDITIQDIQIFKTFTNRKEILNFPKKPTLKWLNGKIKQFQTTKSITKISDLTVSKILKNGHISPKSGNENLVETLTKTVLKSDPNIKDTNPNTALKINDLTLKNDPKNVLTNIVKTPIETVNKIDAKSRRFSIKRNLINENSTITAPKIVLKRDCSFKSGGLQRKSCNKNAFINIDNIPTRLNSTLSYKSDDNLTKININNNDWSFISNISDQNSISGHNVALEDDPFKINNLTTTIKTNLNRDDTALQNSDCILIHHKGSKHDIDNDESLITSASISNGANLASASENDSTIGLVDSNEETPSIITDFPLKSDDTNKRKRRRAYEVDLDWEPEQSAAVNCKSKQPKKSKPTTDQKRSVYELDLDWEPEQSAVVHCKLKQPKTSKPTKLDKVSKKRPTKIKMSPEQQVHPVIPILSLCRINTNENYPKHDQVSSNTSPTSTIKQFLADEFSEHIRNDFYVKTNQDTLVPNYGQNTPNSDQMNEGKLNYCGSNETETEPLLESVHTHAKIEQNITEDSNEIMADYTTVANNSKTIEKRRKSLAAYGAIRNKKSLLGNYKKCEYKCNFCTQIICQYCNQKFNQLMFNKHTLKCRKCKTHQ